MNARVQRSMTRSKHRDSRGRVKAVFALLVICALSPAHADVGTSLDTEIGHLLGFVQNSTCKIIRNGTAYTGRRAVSHIQRKYDYFRNDIDTTEQFIELSASQSTISGKDYTVSCGDAAPIHTRTWLLEELQKYRARR